MWIAIYITEDKKEAENIKKKLQIQGYLIKTKQFKAENDKISYQILSPESEVLDIQQYLYELGF